MRITVPMLVVCASLSACGGGGGPDDSSVSEKDRKLSAEDSSVSVYKSTGATQCAGNGMSLTTMQGQLTAVKVEVRSAACGADGMVYPAACGASDGRIGVFQIPAAQVSAAAEAGFALLSTRPDATIVPCT